MMKGEKFMLYLAHHAGYGLCYETEIVQRDSHVLSNKAFQERYGLTKGQWFTAKLRYGDPCRANEKLREQIYRSIKQSGREG